MESRIYLAEGRGFEPLRDLHPGWAWPLSRPDVASLSRAALLRSRYCSETNDPS